MDCRVALVKVSLFVCSYYLAVWPDAADSEVIMKYRKTNYYARTSYSYIFADGTKITIKPGDESFSKDYEITPEMIKLLHSMDDAEVYNNIKNSRPVISHSMYQQIREWEDNHPGETAPRNWNLSLDIFLDDDTDVESLAILKEIYDRYHETNYVKDKVDEIIDTMPDKTRTIFLLSWVEGYTQGEIAKMMGCSQANVSKHISRAINIIRKNF